MNFKLQGKVALVTGGSRGIGAAICRGLAAEGVHVGFNYNQNPQAATALAEELRSQYGVKSVTIQADVADEASVGRFIETVSAELGPVDILVNNAAYCPSGPATSYSMAEWEKTFAVNVSGTFIASRELLKLWQARQAKGCIVNIASQAAFLGSTSGHLPYDSSKGAMISMTRALAREYGRAGIRVNAVAPGMVRTEMVAANLAKKLDSYLARIPIYRIAEPEEIANVVTFLASDAASYITGATIDATGGMIMH